MVKKTIVGLNPIQQRPNDENVKRPKAVRNTKQYHTTMTAKENMDTPCIDDMIKGGPSDRARPPEFEFVQNREAHDTGNFSSANREQQMIPATKSAKWNLDGDKQFSDVVKVDGYNDKMLPGEQAFRKQPTRHEFTEEESRRISGYGVVDSKTKLPTYTGTASKGGYWTSPKANREVDPYAP